MLRRLGDQVADGEDETVLADDDAVTAALGAERARGERIVGDERTHQDDRVERARQVERDSSAFGCSDSGKAQGCVRDIERL